MANYFNPYTGTASAPGGASGYFGGQAPGFPDASALEAAHIAAQRLGEQRAMQAPQFIEPDIVQPPQMDERSIKLQTIAELLSALGAMGQGAQPTVAPIGTARAGQRAGQADVAKQRQQIAEAKAEFDMKLKLDAYARNMNREEDDRKRKEDRVSALQQLGEELSMRAAARAKQLSLPPTVSEIAGSVSKTTSMGAQITLPQVREMLAAIGQDTPEAITLVMNYGLLGMSGFKERTTARENVERIKAEARENPNTDLLRVLQAEGSSFARETSMVQDTRAKLVSKLASLGRSSEAVAKVMRDAGLNPANEASWADAEGMAKVWHKITPSDEGFKTKYGTTNNAELVRLKAEYEKVSSQLATVNADLEKRLLKTADITNRIAALGQSTAPSEPAFGLTPEEEAAINATADELSWRPPEAP